MLVLLVWANSFAQFDSLKTEKSRIVSGLIVDEKDNPLPWVSVFNKNSRDAVYSNFDGKFTIEAKPTDSLEFRFAGMHSQKIGAEASDITIKMVELPLLEIVYGPAYYPQSKPMNTSVVKVKAKDIKKINSESLKSISVFVIEENTKSPLAGAYVRVKGARDEEWFMTDVYGQVNIECKKGEIIIVSCIGFHTAEVEITKKDNYLVYLKF